MYEEILDLAEELFMKQGYNDTSTRQVASILNITQPNIYYHFKNKEDIYFNVMQRLGKEVAGNLSERAENQAWSFEEKIWEMAYYLQQRHRYSLFMMMHDIQYNLTPEIAKELYFIWEKSYKQPFFELFEKHKQEIQVFVEIDFAVSQLFILISASLDQPKKKKAERLKKSINLFFHGILEK